MEDTNRPGSLWLGLFYALPWMKPHFRAYNVKSSKKSYFLYTKMSGSIVILMTNDRS